MYSPFIMLALEIYLIHLEKKGTQAEQLIQKYVDLGYDKEKVMFNLDTLTVFGVLFHEYKVYNFAVPYQNPLEKILNGQYNELFVQS